VYIGKEIYINRPAVVAPKSKGLGVRANRLKKKNCTSHREKKNKRTSTER
jgi:hypothetical protein